MCIQVQDSTSSADLPSLEAVVQIKGSGRSSSAVFQAAAYGLAHCSWLSASLFSACSNFRRSPPFLHQRLGIVVEASEGPSARTSLAFKLLLSRGVMGKYVGRRNSPLSVAWISTSHSGFPKLFHQSSVSSKTSFRPFRDVRCKLLAFSNSALSILHLFSLLLRFFLKLRNLQTVQIETCQ